jgi:hypothetical protein
MCTTEKSLLDGLRVDELRSFGLTYNSNSQNVKAQIKVQLHNEVEEKYDYMFANVSHLFCSRFDYIIESLKLPMTYKVQYKKAMGWYQEMLYHIMNQPFEEMAFIANNVYGINKFIQKWSLEHPDDVFDNIALYKELLLSDIAMTRMRNNSPKLLHLELMDKMESITFAPYILITKEEYEYDKANHPELFIQHVDSQSRDV